MKKFISGLALAATLFSGAAMADVSLNAASLDSVTAGTTKVGGVQEYVIKVDSRIYSRPQISGNVAGAGAVADALGKNTFTDAKATSYTVQGFGSSSTAGAVSASTGHQRKW